MLERVRFLLQEKAILSGYIRGIPQGSEVAISKLTISFRNGEPRNIKDDAQLTGNRFTASVDLDDVFSHVDSIAVPKHEHAGEMYLPVIVEAEILLGVPTKFRFHLHNELLVALENL